MKIGLIYAMTGEIESLLTKENAEPLQTVAGVSFYRIRPKFAQVVVLPTPPFWLAMAMICVFMTSPHF